MSFPPSPNSTGNISPRHPVRRNLKVIRNNARRLSITDQQYYEASTCRTCPQHLNCSYAFDAYNSNGDCLAIK